MYKFKVFPEHNVVITKIKNNEPDQLLDIFKDTNVTIFEHPDYCDNMNFIIDYRDAVMPERETFYNELARSIQFKCKFNKIIRIVHENEKKFIDYLNIFNIFYRGQSFRKKAIATFSTAQALNEAGIFDNPACLDFLEEKD